MTGSGISAVRLRGDAEGERERVDLTAATTLPTQLPMLPTSSTGPNITHQVLYHGYERMCRLPGFLKATTRIMTTNASEAGAAGLPIPRNIVAVIGTTGVGKSQLAVDLARYLRSNPTSGNKDATVLSSDSMQLYQGLPLITNKITEAEMGGVEHWGIDVVRPGEGGSWEVGKWCQEALSKVRPPIRSQQAQYQLCHNANALLHSNGVR
jgi:hypothetical protein